MPGIIGLLNRVIWPFNQDSAWKLYLDVLSGLVTINTCRYLNGRCPNGAIKNILYRPSVTFLRSVELDGEQINEYSWNLDGAELSSFRNVDILIKLGYLFIQNSQSSYNLSDRLNFSFRISDDKFSQYVILARDQSDILFELQLPFASWNLFTANLVNESFLKDSVLELSNVGSLYRLYQELAIRRVKLTRELDSHLGLCTAYVHNTNLVVLDADYAARIERFSIGRGASSTKVVSQNRNVIELETPLAYKDVTEVQAVLFTQRDVGDYILTQDVNLDTIDLQMLFRQLLKDGTYVIRQD